MRIRHARSHSHLFEAHPGLCKLADSHIATVYQPINPRLYLLAGAHEPPKAAKEHATECHQNPNYIITFELKLAAVTHIWFQIMRLWFPYMETT